VATEAEEVYSKGICTLSGGPVPHLEYSALNVCVEGCDAVLSVNYAYARLEAPIELILRKHLMKPLSIGSAAV